MKKIQLLFTAAAAVLFASCNMDLAPVGSLDDENAIESSYDLFKARNGIYESLRGVVTGGYLYYSDIQMDQFMGLTINGNRQGTFAHGNIYSNNSDIEGVWASMYASIADCNYLLKAADNLLAKEDLTEEDLLDITRYVAETKFARAYYYYYLFDKFCETYTDAIAETPAKGLPLVTVFNPTGNRDEYPGRSTLAETFALIDQDLKDAYNGLVEVEKAGEYSVTPMAMYVNSYVVLSLQARLALLRQDWDTAIEKANQVINSGIYTLAGTGDYAAMWTADYSNEIIFRPISTKTEVGISSTGGAYISASADQADYIPTYENYALYVQNDVRRNAFFTTRSLSANGTNYPAFCFNKFPGNPELNPGTTNALLNMGKPFRLSETYLILAEASYNKNDETTANQALNTIRKNRIGRYTETTYSGLDLRDEIRQERAKELIGEGFRMSDLRRWGLGFTRDSSYPVNPATAEIFVTVDTQVSYIPGDHRYVWPIPSTEMENNPQLKGQQNPGY